MSNLNEHLLKELTDEITALKEERDSLLIERELLWRKLCERETQTTHDAAARQCSGCGCHGGACVDVT